MAKPMHAVVKYAFQCKNCGTLETAEAAGDNPVPRACRICRAGVRFEMAADGSGFSVIEDPDNWIVLADSGHKGKVAAPPKGKNKTATATERMGAKDRG